MSQQELESHARYTGEGLKVLHASLRVSRDLHETGKKCFQQVITAPETELVPVFLRECRRLSNVRRPQRIDEFLSTLDEHQVEHSL